MADTTAPTTPGTPVASNKTGSSVTLTWTPSTDDTAVTQYDIYNGASLFQSVTSSASGVAKTLPSSGFWKYHGAYSPTLGQLVVPGYPSAATTTFLPYSSDGTNWNATTLSAAPLGPVVWGNGKFVTFAATGGSAYSYTSTDGINWTKSTPSLPSGSSINIRKAIYGGGKFVATGYSYGSALYSTDGVTWSQSSFGLFSSTWSVAYGNGLYVAVPAGTGSGAVTSAYATSTDGITWNTSNTLPVTGIWTGITYTGTSFVVVSTGTGAAGSTVALTSTNGTTWAQKALPTTQPWGGVEYSGGTLVAIVTDSSNGYNQAAKSTDDGANWTLFGMGSTRTWTAITPGPTNGSFFISSNAPTGAAGVTAAMYSPLPANSAALTLVAGNTYSFNVKAKDAAGNTSAASGSLSVDNAAPAAPGTPTTAITTGKNVQVSWTAVTDPSTPVTYAVQRSAGLTSGVAAATFSGITSSPYTDTGITVNDWYHHRVNASDSAANTSAYSSFAPYLKVSTNPLSSALTDNFNGASIDTTKWSLTTSGGSSTLDTATGRVALTVPATTSSNSNLISASSYAALESFNNDVYARVFTPTNLPGTTDTRYYLMGAGGQNEMRIRNNGTVVQLLTVCYNQSGTPIQVAVPYDAVNHAWWKMSFAGSVNASSGAMTYTVTFFTAPDNNGAPGTWTQVGSTQSIYQSATNIFESTVKFTTSGVQSTPSTWYIDNVNVPTGAYVADTTAPDLATGLSATATGRSVTFSWTGASDATSFRVYRDGVLKATQASSPFTETVSADGTYAYTVASSDAAGNWSAQTANTNVTVDTVAPTVPTISSGIATGSSVTISWNTNADVSLYEVFRGGVSQGTTASASFTQTVSDGTYAYTVRGKDAAGNWSAQSSASNVTVDTVAPTVPTISSVTNSGSSVTVSWNTNSDVVLYEVFRGGVSQGTTASTSFTQTVGDGTYSYTVRGKDAAGNWSAQSSSSNITVDTTAPTVPTISSVTNSGSSVTISWNSNSDVALYEVFRGGTSQGTTTSTSFTQSVSDGSYTYTVRGKDIAGNWSAQSTGSSITVDTVPPSVPIVSASQAAAGSRLVHLTWQSISDATLFEISRDSSVISTSTTNSYDDTPTADGTYAYKVRAQDTAGNWSALSTAASATVDTVPPSVPVVTGSQAAAGSRVVNLSWSSISDAVQFEVSRDSTVLGTTTSTSYSDTPTADGTYAYSVRAKDSTGNWSASSSGPSVTVDTVAPDVPSVTLAQPSASTTRTVNLSWQSISDAVQFEISRNGTVLGTSSTNSYSDTPSSDGTYTYSVRAKDSIGNWSSASTGASVTIDLTPPTVPTVTSSVADGTRLVQLSWDSDGDVAEYEIQRDGSTIGTSVTAGYLDSSLTSDGSYSYTVRARDSHNNWSAYSSATSVSIDITPPNVPTLSLDSKDSSGHVSVKWNSVAGAVLYEIYRDEVLVGNSTSTTFSDTPGLGSFVYRVRAKDSAGNWSAQSTALSVLMSDNSLSGMFRAPLGDTTLFRLSDDASDEFRRFSRND